MKFFIVTPSFNSLQHLPAAICSVRNQASTQIAVHHHVQDGGSTDGTVEFLEKYAADVRGQMSENNDSNARNPVPGAYSFSFSSEKDEGMYDAINRGWAVGAMDADVIAWLNCDEQVLPGAYQRGADFFGQHPEHDAVCGSLILVDEKGDPIAARRESIPLRKNYLRYGPLYAMSCTLFFRADLWRRGLLSMDTSYKYVADADLILRLLDAKVAFGYISAYQALFSVLPGENLSCRAQQETMDLQRNYGRRSSRVCSWGVRGAKYVEKLLRGCYRLDDLNYPWLDSDGVAQPKIAARVGFRFKGHWEVDKGIR